MNSLALLSALSTAMSLGLGLAYRWTVRRLGRLPGVTPLDWSPAVSVVIPARNEARDLGESLRSWLAQDYTNFQVIVVNDHSTDDTRAIAETIAAEDPRVSVLHDPPLKPGWLGKVNAMQHGLDLAEGEFIVFSDADVRHEPRCLSSAVSYVEQRHADFLSFWPRFDFESFWENVLLPHAMIAGTIMFMAGGANRPGTRTAAAAGAFMLARRDVLQELGGLEPIRLQILDDIELARSVKAAGFDAKIYPADDLLSVRLFKSNTDAFWGLTKNVLGSVKHLWLAPAAMFLPIFVYWLPLVTFGLGLAQGERLLMVAGSSAYAMQAALLLIGRRMYRVHWWKALFFPLSAIPVFCCFARALHHRLLGGATFWRGRLVPLR